MLTINLPQASNKPFIITEDLVATVLEKDAELIKTELSKKMSEKEVTEYLKKRGASIIINWVKVNNLPIEAVVASSIINEEINARRLAPFSMQKNISVPADYLATTEAYKNNISQLSELIESAWVSII